MNWTLIKYLGIVGAVMAFCITIHNWRVDNLSAAWAVKREQAVATARTEEQTKCGDAARNTKDVSHALQARLNDINARYVSLLKQAACSDYQPANLGGGNDGAPSANQLAGLSLDERRLNDKQAAQLVSCQSTITFIYTDNGRADLLP